MMHSTMENHLKYTDIVITSNYDTVTKQARIQQLYHVRYLTHTSFRNYKKVSSFTKVFALVTEKEIRM